MTTLTASRTPAPGRAGVHQVKGSQGNTYITSAYHCTCKGFQFRRSCKHLEGVAKERRQDLESKIWDLYR
jgi:hypothetical protein